MADYYDKSRLIVARMEGEKYPLVVGGIPQSTWEIIPPEEWDKLKNEMAEKWLGPDWTAYDYIEIVVTIPCAELNAMFDAREVVPAAVEMADD